MHTYIYIYIYIVLVAQLLQNRPTTQETQF